MTDAIYGLNTCDLSPILIDSQTGKILKYTPELTAAERRYTKEVEKIVARIKHPLFLQSCDFVFYAPSHNWGIMSTQAFLKHIHPHLYVVNEPLSESLQWFTPDYCAMAKSIKHLTPICYEGFYKSILGYVRLLVVSGKKYTLIIAGRFAKWDRAIDGGEAETP